MNIKSLKSFIDTGFTGDELRKAGQALKMNPVLYCYSDESGNVRGALRNSQNDLSRKLIRVSLSEMPDGAKSKCDLCDDTGSKCLHSATLALHCLKFEGIFSEKKEKIGHITYSGLPPVSFRTVSSQAHEENAGTRLEVCFPQGLPHFPTRWDKCVFGLKLFSPAREYLGNLSNLRQLHFKETIGANLRISQFSLQERQIIRYLALNVEADSNMLSMNSENLAEFFHCLSGFEAILSGEKTIHVNRAPAEPAIAFYSKSGENMFRPAVLESGRTVTSKNFYIIMGRSGCWIGANGDYWWIPGTIDISILRAFYRLDETAFGTEEADKILSQFPERFFKTVHIETKTVRKKHFTPVYQIRSGAASEHKLEMKLFFDYDGVFLLPGTENIFYGRDSTFRRDKENETLTADELQCFGFIRRSNEKNEFFLNDIESAGIFTNEIVPAWTSLGRKIFFEAGKSTSVPDLKLDLEKIGEDDDNIKFRYHLNAGADSASWTELVRHCIDSTDFFSVGRSSIIHVPEQLKDFALSVWDIVREDSRDPGRIIVIPRAGEDYFATKANSCGIEIRNPDLPAKKEKVSADKSAEFKLKYFTGELRTYQKEGFFWMRAMLARRLNFILADEMGLGKTVQALATIAYMKENRSDTLPVIVLCPSSLVENWELEAKRFTPELRTIIIRGTERDKEFWRKAVEKDIVICSYSIFKRDIGLCSALLFRCIILDEAQHIKNPSTENAKACKLVKAKHRIVLTGTPLENSPMDLWSVFDFLHPGFLGSSRNFKNRFCGPENSRKAQNELASRAGPFILRRKKSQVAPDIPEKTEQLIFCELDASQKKLYQELLEKGRREYDSMSKDKASSRMNVLTCLLRLRQLCCHPLLLPEELRPSGAKSAKTELFQELFLERLDSGHRILFFSQFTSLLKIIRAWLDSEAIAYEYLDGSTQNRMDKVENFNRNMEIPVFLLSLKAGGSGLNLATADRVIIYDPWWNPAVESQASDRAHRIGQTKKVSVLKLAVRNTVEERVIELHKKKKEMFDNLVENASLFRNLTDKDIEFLLG